MRIVKVSVWKKRPSKEPSVYPSTIPPSNTGRGFFVVCFAGCFFPIPSFSKKTEPVFRQLCFRRGFGSLVWQRMPSFCGGGVGMRVMLFRQIGGLIWWNGKEKACWIKTRLNQWIKDGTDYDSWRLVHFTKFTWGFPGAFLKRMRKMGSVQKPRLLGDFGERKLRWAN